MMVMDGARTRYGQWLKKCRADKGITQVQLAVAAGIGQTYLSKIESGKVDLPNAELRDRIHDVLGTTEDQLVAAGVIVAAGRDWRTGALPVDERKELDAAADEIAKITRRLSRDKRERFLATVRAMAELMDG